ncbi:Piwi-domain-containing protein [Polyporus arcularius HHB13444]|uniref:Piwi-domain-containing protein n=1 Tax=Polyporus arcularius HHB13444 TaxID=1314778 RepID=A0A5C3PVT4_9APHY|nr:Piwi-domain-containing protein [Polyporus arcularius HHB13444]
MHAQHISGRHEAQYAGVPLIEQVALRQRVTVRTNMFEITRPPTAVYYQYDEINPPSHTSARNYEIIDRLQSSYAAEFGSRPLYDGRALLYSQRNITIQKVGFCRSVAFSLMQRSHLSLSSLCLRSLIEKGDSDDQEDVNYVVLQLCQLIVRQAPNFRHRFPAHSKSFYVADTAVDMDMGLQVWKGFFQSVRPTRGHLLLNVDHTAAPVYAPGPLLSTMLQFLKLRDPRDLQNLSRPEYLRLRSHLKGVVVRITVNSNVGPKPIVDLVEEAGRQEFDNKEGVRVSVSQHFASRYANGTVRFPRAIGVRVGKSAIIPAEFCEIIPGQLFRKKLPPELQNDFLRIATERPERRLQAIQGAVNQDTFNWNTSDFLKDAGMVVNPGMLEVTGAILKAPKIVYGNGEKIDARNGTWNVVGRKFYLPAARGLQAWAVAVLQRVRSQDLDTFLKTLVKNLRDRAVRGNPPVVHGNPTNPIPTLEDAALRAQIWGRANSPDMILVILPTNAEDCRNTVKVWGDWGTPERVAIPTQCVRTGKWERADSQYCNNLALKINPRLGGINSIIESEASDFLSTAMIVGADVGHPGPGVNHLPSITGLVASVDKTASRWTSFSCLQTPRLEIIGDLEQMMVDALNDFRGYRETQKDPVPPRHVVFFRDGVSEGEYRHIRDIEVPMIKRAFGRVGLRGNAAPKLLFVIVGKRPSTCTILFIDQSDPTRLDRRDADRSGNCPSGFVLFEGLNHPKYDDYYLQSQPGLKGMSRPAHYVVLENEAKLPLEIIGQMAYHLCYQYARATRAVSVPAPAYCTSHPTCPPGPMC